MNRSTSCGVLYRYRLARADALMPNSRCSGCVQWWPDRTATPASERGFITTKWASTERRLGQALCRQTSAPGKCRRGSSSAPALHRILTHLPTIGNALEQ